MENTLYFKNMRDSDQNNFSQKIYKIEQSRMLIKILDNNHINGYPHDFISTIKTVF